MNIHKIAIRLFLSVFFLTGIFSSNNAIAATVCGDANSNMTVNIQDITFLINFLYRQGPSPNPVKAADVNNSGLVNISDVTYMINFLYKGGPKPTCSKYLGQVPPDSIPQIFAPGLISTPDVEYTVSFDPSFQEFYFTRRGGDNISKIYFSEIVNGSWTDPAIAPFSADYFNMEPLLTPDGQKLYFSSDRPCAECQTAIPFNCWYITRIDSDWSAPQPLLTEPFDNIMVMYSTQSSNGNMYFTNVSAFPRGIYYSQFVDGQYFIPQRLDTAINKGYDEAHSYIAPDESYMIFDAENRPGGYGASDLYISFRNGDGSWTESINLGDSINSALTDFCPTVTPDGEYFFFSRWNGSSNDIYWCEANFIDRLRPSRR
jgi:Dockerin type I domain/WD40-like Beta Propeller Repeat